MSFFSKYIAFNHCILQDKIGRQVQELTIEHPKKQNKPKNSTLIFVKLGEEGGHDGSRPSTRAWGDSDYVGVNGVQNGYPEVGASEHSDVNVVQNGYPKVIQNGYPEVGRLTNANTDGYRSISSPYRGYR